MDMKDIVLKITGKQLIGTENQDSIEFVTDGKLYFRGGAMYIVYDESELSGFEGCRTTIRLRGSEIQLKRFGEGAGFDTTLEFREGKRLTSKYETPYGVFDVEVLTKHVENGLMEDGTGRVSIDYDISISGLTEGRNALELEVFDAAAGADLESPALS